MTQEPAKDVAMQIKMQIKRRRAEDDRPTEFGVRVDVRGGCRVPGDPAAGERFT